MRSAPGKRLVTEPAFPVFRWVALLWCVVWVPCYWRTWGAANFLHVCDIAVVLTCIGLWTGNSLLLSAQSVSAILADSAWCLDAGRRFVFGRHLVGGTEYMWDSRYPLVVRLLSLFHIFLPVVLVWSLHRVGYDPRGWKLQSAILAFLLGVSRFVDPVMNLNYAFVDPILHRSWGPAPVHLAVMFVAIVAVSYLPTHLFLVRLFRVPKPTESNA